MSDPAVKFDGRSLDRITGIHNNALTPAQPTPSSTASATSLPHTLKHRYEQFIRAEHKWLLPLLDTAKSLTIFLPGRFSDGEVRSEGIYSVLNLLQVYHDRILERTSAAANNEISLLYVRPQTPMYRSIKLLQHVLTVMYYTEVLIEMIATRLSNKVTLTEAATHPSIVYHKKFKWLVVLAIEMCKVYCRLRILQANGGHMLLTRTNDEIVWDSLQRDANSKKREFVQKSLTESSSDAQSDKLSLPTVQPCQSLVDKYIEHGRYGHPHGRYVAPTLNPVYNTRPTDIKILCEVLYWFRPLVYVSGQIICDEHSWKPWTASLMVDLASIVPLLNEINLPPQQRTEVIRRVTLLSYYLLRSPFFENFTQQPLIRASNILSHVPIVGVVFGNIAELISALQKHYFYVSAS